MHLIVPVCSSLKGGLGGGGGGGDGDGGGGGRDGGGGCGLIAFSYNTTPTSWPYNTATLIVGPG